MHIKPIKPTLFTLFTLFTLCMEQLMNKLAIVVNYIGR
jgi:hypothetical protein